ncbi:MAG: magnesium transporter [Phycisphaerae bacterium]
MTMTSDVQGTRDRIAAALKTATDDSALAAALADVRAADIAGCFELLSEADRSRILYALPARTTAEIVVLLADAIRGDVVEELGTKSLTELVSELPPDDAADMLGDMPEDEAGEILEHMVAAKSEPIEELLEYDKTTAGGIMTPEVVAIPASLTVADAVEYVRRATQNDELHEVYIVDDDKRPIGTVALRRLVTGAPHTVLRDISEPDPVVVLASDDQETVVQIIRKYDASEAGVVDSAGRLIGRITHDDLLDVADEEAEEDILRMAGTDPAELDTTSALRAAIVRLTWLLPCIAGTLVSATSLAVGQRHFDVALFATLALFIPMIGATAGNAGIQISTVIVRGFATGEYSFTKLRLVIPREGRVALALAPVCGLTAWVLVSVAFPFFVWLNGPGQYAAPYRVAYAVGLAMTVAILVAACLGVALPFTFRKIGVDPAISSGPIVTTTNDAVCVTIYMLTAMAIAR